MTKKKIMKNIKTPNKFEDGGYWKDVANNALLAGMGSGIGNRIGGNYDTGDNVSNILSTAGAAAAFIPGPWGAIASTALSAAGGLYNRAVGTDWNEGAVAKAEGNLNAMQNFKSNAGSYDALMGELNNLNSLNTTVKASDLGKDGWFSNKSENKAKQINSGIAKAYSDALIGINNTADNIASDTLANLERNYAAFGGLFPRKKFSYGGQTHGANFTNGLMFINNGGTHESNPYEGVPISMDQEGNPNLVEEGEIIWNDYVFSNRLKVPKSIQKKYKLGNREMTFANAIDKLSKESEERPNDSISMRGLENILMNMAGEQEFLKAKNNTKREGNKFSTGGIPRNDTTKFINWAAKNGISIEDYYAAVNYLYNNNKEWWKNNITNSGWADSYAWDGSPKDTGGAYNAVLNYMKTSSDWKTPAEETVETSTPEVTPVKKYYTRTSNADGGYDIVEIDAPYEGVDPTTGKLWSEANSNLVAVDGGNPTISHEMIDGVDTPIHKYYYTNTSSEQPEQEGVGQGPSSTWLRYAPVVGSAINVATAFSQKPDYTNADAIINATKNATTPIKFKPIGDYLTYNPFDTEYYANQLRAVSGATRRHIMNTSGGNRATAMAGILAADNNTMNQLGDLYRKAAEYNLDQKQKVAGFNRATNITNSEGFYKADAQNQQARLSGLDGIIKGHLLREQIDNNLGTMRSNALTGLFNNLGNIGKERVAMSWLENNPGLSYMLSLNGNGVTFKNPNE